MTARTKEQLLQELQRSQQNVVALLESMAPVQDWQPESVEWSFRYIAAHLATVEQKCYLQRVMRIASGERPYFSHFTNSGVNYSRCDLRDSLRRWIALRQKLIAFVRQLSERQLRLTGVHEAIGPLTVLDLLQEILEQDQGHFRHLLQLIDDYYEEQYGSRPGGPQGGRRGSQNGTSHHGPAHQRAR
ncbi:DinB family protein [Litorilinea aerophila]|uniref:DinB family protein n=1 Tax=Litorilinea aerophila TaxID=1204385 RepID=A0A540VE12_9CHLR|nr:DinB family protein [Litorilinea aerophila]MCC9077248.1 DinB family protein [Litorilinea aerophila]OUC05007.1 hypothetical protein RY27_29895 [Litorilinea aerophila]